MTPIFVAWLGCAGEAPPARATRPDPIATPATVDKLCRLFEGARIRCERAGSTAVPDGIGKIVVATYVDRQEETLGQVTFSGRIALTDERGRRFESPLHGYGWGRDEAFERALHEWAVVSAVAPVDLWIGRPERPALAALEVQSGPGGPTRAEVAGWVALRGWSLRRGVTHVVDHAALLSALAPALEGLDRAVPHTVRVALSQEGAAQSRRCDLDGADAPALCEAAGAYPWPAGLGWELRQEYLLVPPADAPPPPSEEPAPGAVPGPDDGAPAR